MIKELVQNAYQMSVYAVSQYRVCTVCTLFCLSICLSPFDLLMMNVNKLKLAPLITLEVP